MKTRTGGRAVDMFIHVQEGRCYRASGIWRWAVPYEYLFLKIVLPLQKGLLHRQIG